MKIDVYRKEDRTVGYSGKEGLPDKKSPVQNAYEKGNDTDTVTSYGKEPLNAKNHQNLGKGNTSARDGFDNTGTQGKDSLHDDAYPHKDGMETKESAESFTGSSSKDFK